MKTTILEDFFDCIKILLSLFGGSLALFLVMIGAVFCCSREPPPQQTFNSKNCLESYMLAYLFDSKEEVATVEPTREFMEAYLLMSVGANDVWWNSRKGWRFLHYFGESKHWGLILEGSSPTSWWEMHELFGFAPEHVAAMKSAPLLECGKVHVGRELLYSALPSMQEAIPPAWEGPKTTYTFPKAPLK